MGSAPAALIFGFDGSRSARIKRWRALLDEEEALLEAQLPTAQPTRLRGTGKRFPKPRSGDANASVPIDKWRRNPVRDCHWNRLLQDPDVWNEATYSGQRFRRKFRLPRCLVRDLEQMAQKLPQFQDKPAGMGKGRGPPRHPFIYKLLATLLMLGKGVDAETAAEAAQLGDSSVARYFHEICAWLGGAVFQEEVTLPEGEELQEILQSSPTTLASRGPWCPSSTWTCTAPGLLLPLATPSPVTRYT